MALSLLIVASPAHLGAGEPFLRAYGDTAVLGENYGWTLLAPRPDGTYTLGFQGRVYPLHSILLTLDSTFAPVSGYRYGAEMVFYLDVAPDRRTRLAATAEFDLLVADLDPAGVPIYATSIACDTPFIYGSAVRAVDDGTLVVTAIEGDSLCPLSAPGHAIWVLRFDSDGNIQWQYVFQGSSVEWIDSVFALPSAGGAWTILASVRTGSNRQPLLLRLDSMGQLLWARTITESTGLLWLYEATVHPPSGAITAIGRVGVNPTEQACLVSVDEGGAVRWSRALSSPIAPRSGGSSVAPSGDAVLASLWGMGVPGRDPGWTGAIVMADPAGDVVAQVGLTRSDRLFPYQIRESGVDTLLTARASSVSALVGRLGPGLTTAASCDYFVDPAITFVDFPVTVSDFPIVQTATSVAGQAFNLAMEPVAVTSDLWCSGPPCALAGIPVARLMASRNGGDVSLEWLPDAGGSAYNVWYVRDKADIDRARLGSSPQAVGVVDCAAPAPARGARCSDLGAVARDAPGIFHYQVRAYCAGSGEGP